MTVNTLIYFQHYTYVLQYLEDLKGVFHMQVLTICTFGKLYSFERKKNVVPGNEIKRIETEIRNPYFFPKKIGERKERKDVLEKVERKKKWVGFSE